MSDEALQQVMDFMDEFVNSADAQHGFSMTYDFRCLPLSPWSPQSMSTIMRIAEWGNEPSRQTKWTRLNTSCKVVVPSGVTFSMCKGVLQSFFFICPPVCRTYLLTDPDEPEESATIFLPQGNASLEQKCGEDCDEDAEAHSDDGGNSCCGHSADTSETTSASACGGAVFEDEANAKHAIHTDVGSKLDVSTYIVNQPHDVVQPRQAKSETQHTYLKDTYAYALPQHFSIEHTLIFDQQTLRCLMPYQENNKSWRHWRRSPSSFFDDETVVQRPKKGKRHRRTETDESGCSW